MRIKMEWQVRANSTEHVDDLVEFASDTKRGLIASEMVPEDAWVEATSHDFSRNAVVLIRWDTTVESDAKNYEPSASA